MLAIVFTGLEARLLRAFRVARLGLSGDLESHDFMFKSFKIFPADMNGSVELQLLIC